MEFRNKKVVVLGAGISGRSVAQVLAGRGACVTLNDRKAIDIQNEEFQQLQQAGVSLIFGHQEESLLDGTDYVVLSPGISIYIPLIQAARSRNITVMSEIEVAYQLCKAPVIAVTGTNGKTTTTTLIGEMMKAGGRAAVVGGNIGLALSHEVMGVDATGIVVAEISSFQLESIIDFKPHIAAVLNITPDHIDRHRTMAEYQSTKERIFANQGKDDYLILNYDDLAVRDMANRTLSQVFYFSACQELQEGAFVKDGLLQINWQGQHYQLCSVTEMKLFGRHNVENALAACGAALLMGISTEAMNAVLKNFTGVEHRIEPVGTVNGVAYYNDSKATNPESSIKALEAFDGHVVLIAGGRDKNTDLTQFMTLIKEKVDQLILIGEAQERFAANAHTHGISTIHRVDSMEEAVQLAHRIARAPHIVLLSPACASYDMFANYEERGRVFKQLVCRLA